MGPSETQSHTTKPCSALSVPHTVPRGWAVGWVIPKSPWKRLLEPGKSAQRGAGLTAVCAPPPSPLQPLPEMAYNGNPESVGYKIKYSRADGHGKTLSHVVHDRVERECTIEDLEEWTEYRAQVQAFNAVGSGPWSPAVMGRTRESGTGRGARPSPRSSPCGLGTAHFSP